MEIRRLFLRVLGVVVTLTLLLSCLVVIPLTVKPLRYFVVGWIGFLQRVIPSVQIDGRALLLSFGALATLTALLHRQVRIWRSGRNQQWRLRTTLAVIFGVMGSCVAGVFLVGAVHEFVWIAKPKEPVMRWQTGRPALRRTASKYNLKHISLALHNYHDAARGFPAGGTFDGSGVGLHGWMTYLLPYVDQAELYNSVRRKLPWNDPVQRRVFTTVVPVYQNPGFESLANDGYAPSSYSANKLVIGPNLASSIGEITDGTSNTILAGEVTDNLKPWGHPVNYRDPRLGINRSPSGFGSPWVGGALFLMGDGSVRFISENIDPQTLQSLATPAADDPVGAF